MIDKAHLPPMNFNPVIWVKKDTSMKSALIKHCPDYKEVDNKIDWIIQYEWFNHNTINKIVQYANTVAAGIPLVVRSGEDNSRLLLLCGSQLMGNDSWKQKGGTLLEYNSNKQIFNKHIILRSAVEQIKLEVDIQK